MIDKGKSRPGAEEAAFVKLTGGSPVPISKVQGTAVGKRDPLRGSILDTWLPLTRGGWHVGLGYEPFVNAAGTYKHKRFLGGVCAGPEADQTIALLLAESDEAECVGVPVPDGQRLDTDQGRQEKNRGEPRGRQLCRLTVHSGHRQRAIRLIEGRKARRHGWFRDRVRKPGQRTCLRATAASVSVDEHDALCVALGKYIGVADPASTATTTY